MDRKGDSYDSIFVNLNRPIKMVYYKSIKITINISAFAKVIVNVVIRYYGLLDSTVINRRSFFTLKFWSSLFYFFGIKQKLFTAFHPKIDGQTKRQNSTMEAYLQDFVNFKQNDWAQLLSITEFAYNNAKNAGIGHITFELNYKYHPCITY